MQILEQFSQAKGKVMEDTLVVSSHFAAVFDGATPKTAFRFHSLHGETLTPGQLASSTLADALMQIPPYYDARKAIDLLSQALRNALDSNQAEASGVIYSAYRNEIWSVGDCQFGVLRQSFEVHHTEKLIDHQLGRWRSSIVKSFLSRKLLSAEQIAGNDPGRALIQPFITRQRAYQNLASHPLGFGVFDGNPVPDNFLEIYKVPNDASRLILASDGYPVLFPTLIECERALQQRILKDPLCIEPPYETKGLVRGNRSYDDRTYLSIQL